MRYTLLASLLPFLLIQLLESPTCIYSCTSLSSSELNMCFGKTKTLKSLREQCTSSNESDLGFNLDDRCDYIDHDQLKEMKPCKSSLFVLQLNCRGTKSKLDEIDLSKNCQHNSYEHFFIELKGSSYNTIIGSLYRK